MTMDHLDEVAVKALDGYLVRKDLVRKFSKQFPVPTYVVEFLLGRYCASTDEAEIAEGLELVQKSLQNKAVSNGNEELFKAHAREKGKIKIIDLVTAKLDSRRDVYVAKLPSLQLDDVRISRDLVMANERMLTGGFYAEVTLEYDKAMTDQHMNPFGIVEIREIQLSKADVLQTLCEARKAFTTEEWKAFLLRCAGYEPTALSDRERDALLLRMVPLVERNYNMVEIGPRGTGKSHLFQQITPYARLISGGKPTVAQLFVNNATGQRGLVCHYDVVCFDEITGISFKEKEGVNIMKGYMESGEFSRGRESIRGDGGIVMVGNFDVDMEHQKKIGHLLKPLPPEMRDDMCQRIMDSTRMLTNILDDLILISDYESRTEKSRTEDCLIASITDQAIDAVRPLVADGVTIESQSSLAPEQMVKTTPIVLQNILAKLLENAAKFTTQGHITLTTDVANGQLHMAVIDTGPGIPADKHIYVFKRFTKLDSFSQGAGLGLSVARLLAEHMGGTVTIDANYQDGAKFDVIIPIA